MKLRRRVRTNVTTEQAIELDIYKNITHSFSMNPIKVKDKVIVAVVGTEGVVVATHTYKETGVQVASIKDDDGGTVWVDVAFLKKVS